MVRLLNLFVNTYKRMAIACVTFSIVFLFTGSVPANDSTSAITAHNAEELRRIGELRAIAVELRGAILRIDTETLLRYVEIDQNHFHTREEARQILQDPKSPAHCLLFDTRCRLDQLWNSGGEGNPYQISALDFFRKHRDVSIQVRFYGQGARRLDFAHILYMVRGGSYDQAYPEWLGDPSYWKKWGEEYIDACFRYSAIGWRYHAGSVGVFFCKDE